MIPDLQNLDLGQQAGGWEGVCRRDEEMEMEKGGRGSSKVEGQRGEDRLYWLIVSPERASVVFG